MITPMPGDGMRRFQRCRGARRTMAAAFERAQQHQIEMENVAIRRRGR
jgi:hypothetical protein